MWCKNSQAMEKVRNILCVILHVLEQSTGFFLCLITWLRWDRGGAASGRWLWWAFVRFQLPCSCDWLWPGALPAGAGAACFPQPQWSPPGSPETQCKAIKTLNAVLKEENVVNDNVIWFCHGKLVYIMKIKHSNHEFVRLVLWPMERQKKTIKS